MTQELWDLRKSILDGLYDDALVIVDELELMSRKSYSVFEVYEVQ